MFKHRETIFIGALVLAVIIIIATMICGLLFFGIKWLLVDATRGEPNSVHVACYTQDGTPYYETNAQGYYIADGNTFNVRLNDGTTVTVSGNCVFTPTP